MGADRLKVLFSQRNRKYVVVRTCQYPLNVRVFCRVEFCERISRATQDTVGNAALNITKELRIAPHASHDSSRKKDAEEKTPASVVPAPLIKLNPLRGCFRRQQFLYALARVYQWKHSVAEHLKIVLEFAYTADTRIDEYGAIVPKFAGASRQAIAALLVKHSSLGSRPRTKQLQKLAILQSSIGGGAQLHTGELRRTEINRHYFSRLACEQGKGVVAG